MLTNRGFTLLEVLIALALFAIAALALAKIQVVNIQGSGFNRDAITATTLAQKKMEELKSLTYGSIATNVVGVQEQVAGITYTTTWTVNESGSSPSRIKRISVTVSWENNKNITLDTIISEV